MTLLEGRMPTILRTLLQAGTIIIHCEDEGIGWQLEGCFHQNKKVISGTALKVMSEIDLSKPVKEAFKMKDTYIKEPALLLKQLNKLNPEFKSEEWIHKLIKPYSIRWIFEVDQLAVEAIQRADFGACTGLDREIFKILSDPNKPRGSVAETQSISSQVSDSNFF